MKKAAVIMGSDSDWPVVKAACQQLDAFGIPYEAHILSAHRSPAAAADFAKNARANGFGVLICAAGMAAHLAGAFAGNSTLPVIGIPMKGGAVDGLDALLSTVQMPSGIPVATVAINGAKMPPCSRRRSSPSVTKRWPKSSMRSVSRWRSRSPRRKPGFRRSCPAERQRGRTLLLNR